MGFFQKLRRKVSGTGAPPTSIAATGDITTGLDIIKNVSISTATIFEGCSVTGTGIPAATTVLKILNSNTVLISNNATATTAALAITFGDLFKYGQIATDGASFYYASQTNTVNRALAATGNLNESFDGIKNSTTWVRSGTSTLGDTQPVQNHDLTRKDYVKSLINNSGKRQFIMGGRHMHHRADFLEVGAGLTAVLKASPATPFIASCANGFEKTGSFSGAPSDLIMYKDTDSTFTALYPYATNFLFGERNVVTGDLIPKSTVLAPIYDSFLTDDRGGKALFTFDGGTPGDTVVYNSFNNSPEDGKIQLLGGAQLDNAVLFGASTSNLWLDQTVPGQHAVFQLEEVLGLQNDMHQEICFETFFYPTNAASGGNQFLFSSDTIGVYLDATGVLHMDVSIEKYGAYGAALVPQPGGALAAHGGLGAISGAGVLSSASWYHVAVTLDGFKFNVFLNGYLYATLDFLDSTAPTNGVYDALLVTNLSWVSQLTYMFIGVYSDQVSGFFDGYISYFSVKPYNKYRYNRHNWLAINSPIFFVPTIAATTADVVKNDRYFQQLPDGLEGNGNCVMFNFDTISTTEGVHDFYNNTIRFIGGNETVGGPYLDTAQKKFGASSLRFPGIYSAFPAATGYLNTALFNMPRLDYGNFTFEFWVRPNDAGDAGGLNVGVTSNTIFRQDPYGTNSDGIYIGFDPATDDVKAQFGNLVAGDLGSLDTAVDAGAAYAGTFTPGAWHHLAVTGRLNSTNNGYLYCFFVDGNKIGEIASASPINHHDWGFFGCDLLTPATNPSNFVFRGWIDDVHCTQICKYTAAFTPPAAANIPTDYGATPTGTNIPGTYQYYYDIPTGIMYKGYVGNWTAVTGIFVGEASLLTQAVNTENTVSYTVGTKFRTLGRSPMINDNSTISFRHNFGTNKVRVQPRARLRYRGTFGRGYEYDIVTVNRVTTDFSTNTRAASFRNIGYWGTSFDASFPSRNILDALNTIGDGSTSTISLSSGTRLTKIFFDVERLF